jgi:hypothetical protein
MVHERLSSTRLARTLAEVAEDFVDLAHKELQLARAELSSNLTAKVQAAIWVVAGATLLGLALLLALQAAVFAISSYGMPLHWSFLIVASITAVSGLGALLAGRTEASRPLIPERTVHQLQQDATLGKEQLT